MLCSILYEDLKARAFDGDLLAQKAWADAQLAAPPDAVTPSI